MLLSLLLTTSTMIVKGANTAPGNTTGDTNADLRTCHDCDNGTLCGNCTGRYCVTKMFYPKWDSMKLGPHRIIKGCLEGELMADNIEDHCKVTEHSAQHSSEAIDLCFCKSRDFCNEDCDVPETVSLPSKLERLKRCRCDRPTCRMNFCYGEYCTILKDRDGATHRDCYNASTSLFERPGVGAIIQPPMSIGLDTMGTGGDSNSESLNSILFLCANHDNCNAAWPQDNKNQLKNTQHHQLQKCPMSFNIQWNALAIESKIDGSCLGEYCWNTTHYSSGFEYGSMSFGFTASGCMTFKEGGGLDTTLYDHNGCMNFESSQLTIHTCLHRLFQPSQGESDQFTPNVTEIIGDILDETSFLRQNVHNLTARIRSWNRIKLDTEDYPILIGIVLLVLGIVGFMIWLIWRYELHKTMFSYVRFKSSPSDSTLHHSSLCVPTSAGSDDRETYSADDSSILGHELATLHTTSSPQTRSSTKTNNTLQVHDDSPVHTPKSDDNNIQPSPY